MRELTADERAYIATTGPLMHQDENLGPIIVAVDPGSYYCGVSVWEALPQGYRETGKLLACFTMIPPRGGGWTALKRAEWLLERLGANLAALGVTPGVVVCEHLVGASVRPAPQLETVILAIQEHAQASGWPYVEYSPNEWRAVVQIVGADRVNKGSVQWAMEARLPVLRWLRTVESGLDAVEAAAIGLFHLDQMRVYYGGAVVPPAPKPKQKKGKRQPHHGSPRRAPKGVHLPERTNKRGKVAVIDGEG